MIWSSLPATAVIIVVFSLVAQVLAASGLSYNGLALTPQMGWDTFNAYALDYDEDILMKNAQRLVDLGLRDLGYNVVILDDAMTEKTRSHDGKLIANATRFPSGLKSISKRFHNMGLQFGVYSSAGRFTCGGYPASLGYEEQDAQWWADLGVDYLKHDNCFNEGQSGNPKLSHDRFAVMSKALNATGRKITYSLCNWGDDKPWEWASTISNSARISGDIYDSFSRPSAGCPCSQDDFYCQIPGYHCNVMNILGKASAIVSKNQPGYWNDLDMLEVGNGGMSYDEYKTHFSMWAIIKSPLIMGNKLDELSPEDYAILINPAVIAINQDPLGSAASRQWRVQEDKKDEYGYGEIQVWSGELANGDHIVAFINGGSGDQVISSTLVEVFDGLRNSPKVQKSWDVYDLWGADTVMSNEVAARILGGESKLSHAEGYFNASRHGFQDAIARNDSRVVGTYAKTVPAKGTLTADIPRHGVALFRLRETSEGKGQKDEL
ncbi:glycoside hydrolase family 27 protein [Aulographum hederae CBS 113979]|uniref:Alpha-galactosidase n=1 Tax=Aulographum hederae CBS 113979 TaxID=1176131 RepID=A0A6G1GW30_9PEZI|nr:glycoside hydrolase family 27 protein [Aulographum hederae CBS 113979]